MWSSKSKKRFKPHKTSKRKKNNVYGLTFLFNYALLPQPSSFPSFSLGRTVCEVPSSSFYLSSESLLLKGPLTWSPAIRQINEQKRRTRRSRDQTPVPSTFFFAEPYFQVPVLLESSMTNQNNDKLNKIIRVLYHHGNSLTWLTSLLLCEKVLWSPLTVFSPATRLNTNKKQNQDNSS